MSTNLINELNTLHTEFKNAIERSDNAATERLNNEIDKLSVQIKALETAANRPTSDVSDVEVKNFRDFARGRMGEHEYKAVAGTTDAEGAVLVPKIIDNMIRTVLTDVSPIRSIARVVQVSTPNFSIPFSPAAAGSNWVGEKDARPETASPTFTEIVPAFGELYSAPMLTQTILDDSQFDLASFISTSVANEFARAEGAAFVNGNGTNKPKGFLSYTTAATADATRAFGTIQHIASGSAAAMPSSADTFIDIVHSLKAGYRQNAVWVVSKAVMGQMRKYKDSTGQYLWQPSLVLGTPATFCGYPVVEAEDMPAVAAGALPVAFGDFNAGYVIADRIGMTTLVDRYTSKPYTIMYTTKRVGGAVVDSAAIKLLKIAAS